MKRLFKVAVIQAAILAASAHANITDGKYGSDQVYDIYHTGCTVAGGACGLYNFDIPYQGSWMAGVQVSWAAGDYVSFVLVSGTNYKLIQYSSAGVQKAVLQTSGTISSLGDGILYIGTTGFTSTWYYISNNQGVSNAIQYTSANMFTVTTTSVNPTASQLQNYSATTAPLVAGQSAPAPSPPPVTVVSTAPGASTVTRIETSGSTVTTSTVTRGATVNTVTVTDTRDRGTKELSINRSTITSSTTPVTTIVATSTPVTITTVTTPSTVTTYSDGTTATTSGAPVTTVATRTDATSSTSSTNDVQSSSVTQSYSTRIDQMDKLLESNARINQSLLSDPLSRVLVNDDRISNRSLDDRDINAYIHGSSINTNTSDGYSQRSTVDTYGAEHRVNRSTLAGFQYNRASTTMDGVNGGGNLAKEAYTIYGVHVNGDWIYKADLGQSNNTYTSYHTLPELNLSNLSKTNGQDNWLSVRVYTPAMKGFRPFVGSRTEHNTRDYVLENGSFLSAVDYARVSKTVGTSEFGTRYEHLFNKNWAVAGEVSQNDKDLCSIYGTLMYNAENNSIMTLKIGQQRQNGIVADLAQLQIALRF